MVAPDTVIGAVEQYWYWQRAAFLPRPHPLREADGGVPKASAGTSVRLPSDTGWLLAATRAPAAGDRAGAVFALGCAGPLAGGLPRLLALLDDPEPEVQTAAVLGLGEHGGTEARFALVRVFGASARPASLRQLALLAFGIAAGDGSGGLSAAVRPFLSVGDSAVQRIELEAVCAAADLAGGRSRWLADFAAPWFSGRGFASAPARAVRHAVVGAGAAAEGAPVRWLQAGTEPVGLAALVEWVLREDPAPAAVAAHLDRPGLAPTARALLAIAEWRRFPSLATAMPQRPALRLAHGFGLALHARARGWNAKSEVALAEHADRIAEHRPGWLLAAALAGDPGATARALGWLRSGRADESCRLAAVDVLAMAGGSGLESVRSTLLLDPSVAVRLRAADACARHGGAADVLALEHAAAGAVVAEERAALLVALGRTRGPAAAAMLQRALADAAAPAVVRRGAWLGLAHCWRWRGEAPLARLPRGGAYAWTSAWLLDLADAVR